MTDEPADRLLAGQTGILESVATGRPLLETLHDLIRVVEAQADGMIGSVLLLEEGRRLRHAAAPGLPEAYLRAIDGAPIGPRAGSCGTAAHEARRVVVGDIAVDPLWEDWRPLALSHGLRACWSTPILSPAGEVLGTFAFYYREVRVPRPEDLALIDRAAHLASLALHRARQEESLRRSEEHFRLIAGHLPQVIWMREVPGLRILFVSPSYEKIWGRSLDSLLRDPESWLETVHPEDRARAAAAIPDRLREGTPGAIEYRLLRPDGSLRWIRSRMVPIRDAQDRIYRITGIAEDVTEARQAESALRGNERRLRLLVQHTPGAVALFDREMRYLLVSPRWLSDYGLGTRDILGLSHYEVFPEIPERWKEIHRRCQAGAVERCDEDPFLRADGSTDWVRWEVHPWHDDDGAIGGIVMFTEVITARKRAEEELRKRDAELRQSQKMEAVGRLAGGIAHDFNNLLTVINGYAETTLRALGSDHASVPGIREILRAGERAAALTRQLLAFSRKQVLDAKVVDVNDLVSNLDRMLRRLIGEDINLVTRLHPAPARTRVDPGQLEQVIMNLVVNSRDAMPEGGRLTIETALCDLDAAYAASQAEVQPGPYVMIAVSDTGAGMEPEVRARIFEPFFTTKPKEKGTGLGLSTAYGIVRQSGGHIGVYSEPGRGSAFKVYLPRVELPAEPLPPRGERPAAARGTETILLVEDEALVRDFIALVLEPSGYLLLKAARPEEALARCDEHPGPIHLLLTDVVMPGMSGRVLADRLTARRPDTRVLYMSGYTENAIVHHGRLDPGTAFIAKPFTPDDLLRKVREVLAPR